MFKNHSDIKSAQAHCKHLNASNISENKTKYITKLRRNKLAINWQIKEEEKEKRRNTYLILIANSVNVSKGCRQYAENSGIRNNTFKERLRGLSIIHPAVFTIYRKRTWYQKDVQFNNLVKASEAAAAWSCWRSRLLRETMAKMKICSMHLLTDWPPGY